MEKSMAPNRVVKTAMMAVLVLQTIFCSFQAANGMPSLNSHDGILVTAPDGRVIFAHNPDALLIPASTQKIVTALAAIHYLGTDFRFQTKLYREGDDLRIKGYGDPLLISEVLRDIAGLTKNRITTVRDLLMDESYFASPLEVSGVGDSANPYDAPNGALCVNFNTVFFDRRNGEYVSAEPQTPLLPLVINRIRATGLKNGRIILSRQNDDTLLYAGHLFRYFFTEAGIRVTGSVTIADHEMRDGSLLLDFTSPYSLGDVISQLLKYSNNYIANQVLITFGITAFGPPGTLDKGIRALSSYAATVLHFQGAEFMEGSGISHQNLISAAQMIQALSAFEPYHNLMRQIGSEWYKTGHLEDVQTRVGYIEAGNGGLYRYAVLLNTPGKSPDRVMISIRKIVEKDRMSLANSGDR